MTRPTQKKGKSLQMTEIRVKYSCKCLKQFPGLRNIKWGKILKKNWKIKYGSLSLKPSHGLESGDFNNCKKKHINT